MRRITTYILFSMMLIFSISCSKEIEVDLPAYEQKIVVDGWIETNQSAKIQLTRSSAFFSDYDSASIRNLFINTAKITLSSSDGTSEILTLFDDKDYFPPFIYKSIKMKGKENETYTIKVETGGKVITASTTIPAKPIVESVSMALVTDTTSTINALIKDNPEEKNYYYSEILVRNQGTFLHPSSNPVFNDSHNNGELIDHSVKRSVHPDPLNIFGIDKDRNLPKHEYYYKDTVRVRLSSIDEEAYRVMHGLHMDSYNYGNPFALVNQATETNIKGGIGRWIGLGSAHYLVYLTEE